MPDQPNEKIIKLLQEKVLLKQDVFDKTKNIFDQLKTILSSLAVGIKVFENDPPRTVQAEYTDRGEYEVELSLADETLVFVMHTNIFTFESTHEIWKNRYVQQDPKRAYCGKIFIYNFLSDSFKFNRVNDVGYLIARIFINIDKHFFVEGIKQLGYLYNDFSTTILDADALKKILESAILFSLDFDPFTPPFDRVAEISVKDIIEAGVQSRIATGKRLGFQFGNDDKTIIG